MTDPTRGGLFLNTKWGITSVVICTALVVLGGVVVWNRVSSDGGNQAAGAASASAADATQTPDAAAENARSICGLAGHDTAPAPDLSMTNTTWVPTGSRSDTGYGGDKTYPRMLLPSIDGAGPGTIAENGVRTCFAHTNVGAVLAAANMLSAPANPEHARELIEATTAEGPGRQFAAEGAANYFPSPLSPKFVGYRVDRYTSERARVTIANQVGIQLISVTVDMVWEDGDWKAAVTAAGDMPVPSKKLTSLGGFTPWAAA